jgi:glycine dehydrogenase subunit 2
VTAALAKFLPAPMIDFDGSRYVLNYDLPDSIGKVHQFLGCPQVVLRAYTWLMALGADGLREVAEIAVLNNNYLLTKMQQIRGVAAPYAKGRRRIEQVRYSWEQLHADTGVTTDDVGARVNDFGTHYWTSHHPFVVPQPVTLEPTESYSRIEIDEYAQIMQQVSDEAYAKPDFVKAAPYNTASHRTNLQPLDDPSEWAMTWRAYRRKLAEKQAQP